METADFPGNVRNLLRNLCLVLGLAWFLSPGGLLAQGWTFTFTLSSSGPCGVYMPVLPTFSIPYMTTQAYCESIRQSVLGIRVSQPMYDEHGNYIGECAVFYTATPCTGSDIPSGSGGEFGAGAVSIDGPLQGSAFFAPHQTQEFEYWMQDFQVRLKSMGINPDASVLQQAMDVPLTGDHDFDSYYMNQVLDFDKPANKTGQEPPPLPPAEPAPDRELPAVTGSTVQLLTDSEEQRKRDDWMTRQGFNDLHQVGEANTLDAGGSDPAEMSWSEAALREYVGDNVAGNFALKVVDGTTTGISDVVGKLSRGDMEGAAEQAATLDRNVAVNAAVDTGKDVITGGVTDLITGPVLGLVKGAGTVSSVIGKGINIWNTKHGK